LAETTVNQNKIEKIKKIISLIGTEEFKRSFNLCKLQLFKILKRVMPKKWKLRLKFGFDDPYYTGQTLAYYSLVHPLIYKNSEVVPDFDNSVFDGDIKFKGKIRGITILVAGLKILLSKDIRQTIKLLKRI